MSATPERVNELATQAATRVVGHLEGERLIPRFIDSYVIGFDRPQLKNPPEPFRERSQAIGREALLLLGRLVAEKCGQQFHRLKLGPLQLADRSAARRFQEAFWLELGAQLKMGPGAGGQLARQAEEYGDAAAREARFAERIAPLLDPAPQMKDKAEHAGHKFFEALDKVAAQVAKRVFGQD